MITEKAYGDKILSIEFFDRETDYDNDISGLQGILITTDKQKIVFGISNEQDCCENWGTRCSIGERYIDSPDDLEEYVGSYILSIVGKYAPLEEAYHEGDQQFLDINTTKGTFTFYVYNSHNGYYSHGITIECLKYEGEVAEAI